MQFKDVITFGCSPSMLFNQAFTDEMMLYVAYHRCCSLPMFEAMESFLPDDPELRRRILALLRESNMILNYNTPGYFQTDGPYNNCSDDPANRANAWEAMLRHLSYAAEAGSSRFIVTGCADQGVEKRPGLIARYEEFFLRLCEEAKKVNIRILLEPIERHRFKRLLWGPTAECAEFIRRMRAQGADNAGLMMDIAHLPLMEETVDSAIADCGEIGFEHVHLGDAVLTEGNPFYGHTHPPLEVRGALFGQKDFAAQFAAMIGCGFISEAGPRASISLEVSPYPGVREETSLQVMYEKCLAAFNTAAAG